MKINNLFEDKEDIITESIRFGNKEKKLVDFEARNIIVGVEYEYHVDEDAGNFEDEESDYDNDALPVNSCKQT